MRSSWSRALWVSTTLLAAAGSGASAVGASAVRASAVGASAAGTGVSEVAPLPFLHVVTPASGADRTPYLAGPTGQQVLLRGVAAVGMEDVNYSGADGGPAIFPVSSSAYDGKCPRASPLIPQPPLCEVEATKPPYEQSTAPASDDDFAQMRALGFDVVRLVLDWSQLEPTPGHYSTTFLDRVSQVVGWARQQGIYVILDMHQDQYSRYILPTPKKDDPSGCSPSGGQDGAPRWAVFTDGKPACALYGETDLNPAEAAAFYNFWHNHTVEGPKGEAPGTGLQDHYIGALAALARRFEDNSAVLGYELMNEPQPGSLSSLPLANLYQSASETLYPFYKRAIEALTGVRDRLPTCPASTPTSLSNTCAYPELAHVTRQQIFFEPDAYRNLVDFSPQVSKVFSSYKNLVYAPHIYTHAFTVDEFIGYPATASPYPPSYEFGYETAESEAQAMHAAVFVTEFGDSSGTDHTVLAGETAAQQATLIGGTLWAWKGLSAKETTCWCVRWQHSTVQTSVNGIRVKGPANAPVSPDAELIPSRQRLLDRVWPRETAGRLLAYEYDPTTRTFAMEAADPSTVAPYRRSADTVVYIPSTVHGHVAVSGRARLASVVIHPDGSRSAYVAPTGRRAGSSAETGGGYEVMVGSPSRSLVAGVAAGALHPPEPITEPQARQILDQFLAGALKSTNASIRSNAELANALAGLLLGSTDPNTAAA